MIHDKTTDYTARVLKVQNQLLGLYLEKIDFWDSPRVDEFNLNGHGMENWMICSFSSPDLRRSLSDSHLSTANTATNENGNSTSVEKIESMSQSA